MHAALVRSVTENAHHVCHNCGYSVFIDDFARGDTVCCGCGCVVDRIAVSAQTYNELFDGYGNFRGGIRSEQPTTGGAIVLRDHQAPTTKLISSNACTPSVLERRTRKRWESAENNCCDWEVEQYPSMSRDSAPYKRQVNFLIEVKTSFGTPFFANRASIIGSSVAAHFNSS
jgi:hypothetical protein